MRPVNFYQFWPRQIISIPTDGYFLRDVDAIGVCRNNVHNPEWYIQDKIQRNEDGFFDFSKNMIDVGACYGTYCLTLPFQHCFMFEPNKENLAYCYMNMLVSGKINRCTIHNVAVSDYCGSIEFDGFVSGELANPDGHTYSESKFISVPCITLDSIKNELSNIGFIKIDIEGAEPRALMGMMEVIKANNYPPILFEGWSEGNPNESQEHYESRTHALKTIFDELEYNVLWCWGNVENHLAVHANN